MKKTRSGFTIVELIVSIVVIGILASIVIVSYNGWRKSTITTQVKSDLNGAASAMESARTFNNAYLASITSSTTFKPSQGDILSGGSSDGGQTYCIDASSTQDATVHYYIDSISGSIGAQAGTCATRLVPTLTATVLSISSVNLSWTAVPGATSYTLQIASSSTFADAATIATQSGLTYTSAGLSAATTYYYRVGVTNSPGLWSATQSATTTITAPITPTVIANTAGATTTWQWSATDCPTGTTGRYQYDYTISSGYDSGQVATGSTSISFNTSSQGNTYTVAIQAQCYNVNASSVWSVVGSALYSRPVTAVPTNLIATTASSSSMNISWNASVGAISYTLQRDTNPSFTSATTIATQAGLTFTSSGLNQGTTYYYRVQATDINGTSNWSTTATATTTIDTPAVPTVAANTVTTTTTWSWNAASCAAGTTARYQYDYTISPAGYDSGWVTTAGTSVAFTTSTQGQTYTVTVQAQCTNANTSSGWSTSGSASYYMPITYTLTTVAGSGGSVSSGGTYNSGSTPTITATPNTYYSFSSWSGDTGCSGAASHTITMDSNKYCTANFTPTPVDIAYVYTGGAQTFVAPHAGNYKLEVYGAQGFGGNGGGYSTGTISLAVNQALYIYVGGSSGYNGGGHDFSSDGGGATDIRTQSDGNWADNLYSRIIVAGGSGGQARGAGGSGGGNAGSDGGGAYLYIYVGKGATQSAAGGCGHGETGLCWGSGSFGQGGSFAMGNNVGGGGGGGGWYGGGAGWTSGGGGAGYVLTSSSYKPSGYSPSAQYYLSNTQTTNGVQTGNGSARISG